MSLQVRRHEFQAIARRFRGKMNNKIKKTLLKIISLLVNCDYDAIAKLTKGVRLQAMHIKDTVEEYEKTLILPPDTAYDNLDIIEIENSVPRKWSIRFDLWTKEEGRSDLSIELTLIDSEEDLMIVELDNIHTL
jgi:hypothetical protein